MAEGDAHICHVGHWGPCLPRHFWNTSPLKEGNCYACCAVPCMCFLVSHSFHWDESSMTSSTPEYPSCVTCSCEGLCWGSIQAGTHGKHRLTHGPGLWVGTLMDCQNFPRYGLFPDSRVNLNFIWGDRDLLPIPLKIWYNISIANQSDLTNQNEHVL